jgi:hypothetical protein
MQRALWVLLIAVWLCPTAAGAAPLSPVVIFDRAVATAGTIADPGQHVDALTRIAESRAAFGDQPGAIATWNEAARIAAEIGDPETRGASMQKIIEQRAAAGDVSGALATLEGIERSSERAQALVAIAAAQVAAGNRSDAKTNLREALNEARRLDAGAERDGALHDVAIAQAEQLGDIDGALETTEAVNDAESVAEIRARIAVAQKKSGADVAAAASLQAALSAADKVADVKSRGRLLSSLVKLLADGGLVPDAAMVSKRMLDADYDGLDLEAASTALASAGDLDAALALAKRGGALSSAAANAMVFHNRAAEALGLARTLPDDEERITALLSIARAQRDAGNMADGAATTSEVNAQIEQTTDRNERDSYYGLRAVYQARAESYDLVWFGGDYAVALWSAIDGLADEKTAIRSENDNAMPSPTIVEVEDAVALAHLVTDRHKRLGALALVATPLLLSGDRRTLETPIREALATVSEIPASTDDPSSEIELVYIALTQVAARDFAGAKAMARQLPEPQDQLLILAVVAWGEACMNAGDVAKKTLADALADARETDNQQAAMALVALVQARLGDPEQALATAEGIPEPDRRVATLIAIATGRWRPLMQ